MTKEDYRKKKMQLLNIVAPNVIALHKMKKTQQIIAIMKGTGSEYLANKWDGYYKTEKGQFASRYLNSDSKHQLLWLKMMGVENPDDTDCWTITQAMLFFNNHPLTYAFKEESLKPSKINPFGNGENWCMLWVTLDQSNKDHLIGFF